jgi:hypothetical protein
VLPRVAQIIMNTSFRMFPESSAAQGQKPGEPLVSPPAPPLTPEALAMQQMLRGFHF